MLILKRSLLSLLMVFSTCCFAFDFDDDDDDDDDDRVESLSAGLFSFGIEADDYFEKLADVAEDLKEVSRDLDRKIPRTNKIDAIIATLSKAKSSDLKKLETPELTSKYKDAIESTLVALKGQANYLREKNDKLISERRSSKY